jgi:hypothetical protein
MGYVYGFRHGSKDLFKIGLTTMTPDKRRPSLQTGCSDTLVLFDAIETDEYKTLEKYIKDVWAEHRSTEGGKENYHLTEAEATQLFARCRIWVAEELPKLRQLEQLEDIEPEPTVLPRDDAAERLRDQWIKLRAEEQRHKRAYEQAVAERVQVENELKLAIGTHAGIDGVATWETVVKSRRISAERVQAGEPELFDQCTEPKLNAKKFEDLLKSLGRGSDYESFQEIKRARHLEITEQ